MQCTVYQLYLNKAVKKIEGWTKRKKRGRVINSRISVWGKLLGWSGLGNIEMNLFINEPDCLQCLSNSLIGS